MEEKDISQMSFQNFFEIKESEENLVQIYPLTIEYGCTTKPQYNLHEI